MKSEKLTDSIFSIRDEQSFNTAALEVFNYQKSHVSVFGKFIELLQRDRQTISHYREIPFLPVTLFRNHIITDQPQQPEHYFASSGTSAMIRSRHYVHDLSLYDKSILQGFKIFFGDPEQYAFLALLPSYLEQGDSSLIYMMNLLMQSGSHPDSGFYLNNHSELRDKMENLKKKGVKIFLIGVTYALLDFYSGNHYDDSEVIIVETGGMKGRRKEMIREEVHEVLKRESRAAKIFSEYGMTELLSQAWSDGDGIFKTPPWMKILISDIHDPYSRLTDCQTGSIHVIDLANYHSCSFIATQDIGRRLPENRFEVLGRMDSSELRGCNLMVV